MGEEIGTHLWIPKQNVKEENVNLGSGGQSYSRTDYAEHGQRLASQVMSIKEVVVKKKDTALTNDLIVQVKTPKDVSIKSQKSKFDNLGFEIISYSLEHENAATAKIGKVRFEEFDEKVKRYATLDSHPGRSNIAVIEEIGEVPLQEKLDKGILQKTDEILECIITLFNVITLKEKEAILESIEQTLKSKGIVSTQKKKFLSGNMILVSRLNTQMIQELGQDYITVKSINLNDTAVIEQSIPTDLLPNPLTILKPTTDTIVAIVDSGVNASSPALTGLVLSQIPFLPPTCVGIPYEHGTLVASRVIYGDEIDSKVHTHVLEPCCRIIDIPVFGKDAAGRILGHKEDALVSILDQIVPPLSKDVKVFNLSLGFNRPIERGKYSLLAQELDFLSREYGVLFVIVAGNIRQPHGSFPDHFSHVNAQLQPPAESLLGLSVGSIAKYSDRASLSKINEVSPFSCIGPGADDGIKPEIVAHGGNLLNGWSASPRIGAYGIDVSGRRLAYDVGTSFSAPIISHYAAQIFDTYSNATPNLVKALLCHFAEPVIAPTVAGLTSKVFYGFGEPNLAKCLYAETNSVSYLYEGSIKKDTYQFIKFHLPDSVAIEGVQTRLKIKVTLVYNPPINSDNQKEYSKCRMALSLNKNTSDGLRPISFSSNELNHLMPWNPVLHFEQDFVRNFVPGEWEAKVRLMTRGDLPEDFKQDFALILEVVDCTGTASVYSDIISSYGKIYIPEKLRKVA
ncbi:S8 family peptidase [Desulfosporosinus fructosivorans]